MDICDKKVGDVQNKLDASIEDYGRKMKHLQKKFDEVMRGHEKETQALKRKLHTVMQAQTKATATVHASTNPCDGKMIIECIELIWLHVLRLEEEQTTSADELLNVERKTDQVKGVQRQHESNIVSIMDDVVGLNKTIQEDVDGLDKTLHRMMSGTWSITAGNGGCQKTGNCVHTRRYSYYYENYDWCTITIVGTITLAVESFSTEETYDVLTVNGEAYSGRFGPPEGPASGQITWSSDGSYRNPGWKICELVTVNEVAKSPEPEQLV